MSNHNSLQDGNHVKVSNLKSEIIDSLLSFAPTQSKENLLNEILVDYLSLIDDERVAELEDIIVNQFEAI